MSFYSKISKYYNDIFPFNQVTFEFLKSYVNENSNVLDLGCGTGEYIKKLHAYCQKTVGIDLDEQMINRAQLKPRLTEFYVKNVLEIDTFSDQFDFIYSIGNVVSYLSEKDLETLVQKIAVQLNYGGVWIFQTVNWDRIIKLPTYDFPIIEVKKHDLKFERRYERIDKNSVNFIIKFTKSGKTIFENDERLFGLSSEMFEKTHNKYGLLKTSHWGNFAKVAFNPQTSNASINVFCLK